MIRILTTLLLSSSALLQADSLQEGIDTFRKGYRNWDSATLWNATRDFQKAVKAKPKSAQAHYWLGTAHFHRMLQIESRPTTKKLEKAAKGDREDAIEALQDAVELDDSLAEAHAMLGTLYGMKIDGITSGMRYGRRVKKHQELALKHGKDNPRVQYLLGVALLKTAENHADRKKALEALHKARELYEAEAKKARGKDEPAWGRDACLAFIGKAYSELHNAGKARVYYRKALAVRPNNKMAKKGLANLDGG
ncbi:MAG: tetratricopeptide repeat protein [Akkermansiaceae bacterium]|nr:tetratricopeptide repeat protein [Akkermansiaceae bacterium]